MHDAACQPRLFPFRSQSGRQEKNQGDISTPVPFDASAPGFEPETFGRETITKSMHYKTGAEPSESQASENNGRESTNSATTPSTEVTSPFAITLEYNENIRPKPDAENIVMRTDGGQGGIRTLGTR